MCPGRLRGQRRVLAFAEVGVLGGRQRGLDALGDPVNRLRVGADRVELAGLAPPGDVRDRLPRDV